MSVHLAVSILRAVCRVPTESDAKGGNGTLLLAGEFILIPVKLISAVTFMTVSPLA